MKTDKLHEILTQENQKKLATDHGTLMHKKLEQVFITKSGNQGDKELCSKIASNNELCEYFNELSKTEVPIAGFVDNEFLSRRIDRLYVNPEQKRVVVIDYKTDTDRQIFRDKYKHQLGEYYKLLSQIYPDFTIQCKILWLSDFTLENII